MRIRRGGDDCHKVAVLCGGDAPVLLEGLIPGRHEDNLMEPEGVLDLGGRDEMPVVNRVEGAAHNADAQLARGVAHRRHPPVALRHCCSFGHCEPCARGRAHTATDKARRGSCHARRARKRDRCRPTRLSVLVPTDPAPGRPSAGPIGATGTRACPMLTATIPRTTATASSTFPARSQGAARRRPDEPP